MSTKNDKAILDLKKQIAEKKAALKATEKFSPITTMSLSFDGKIYNLHTLTKEQTIELLSELNALFLAWKDLQLEDDLILSGYKVESWIKDMKSRLMIVNRRMEQSRLEEMELKLTRLLSSDKQVELEIENIKASL